MLRQSQKCMGTGPPNLGCSFMDGPVGPLHPEVEEIHARALVYLTYGACTRDMYMYMYLQLFTYIHTGETPRLAIYNSITCMSSCHCAVPWDVVSSEGYPTFARWKLG